ncbi:hypothetical protein ACS0TY_027858 [Phlomoides rotata]
MTMPKDDKIVLHQWIKLITYWGSDEAKEASKRNKGARAKKTMEQITGKRSFAKVRAKLTKKLGQPPKRSELFGACYVKPNENSSNANEKSSGDALHKYTSDDVPMILRRPVMDIEGWSPENAIKVGS